MHRTTRRMNYFKQSSGGIILIPYHMFIVFFQGQCPSCFKYFDGTTLEVHASECFGGNAEEPEAGML